MSIIVYCKDCGKKIRVPEGPSGRHGKCPQCKARVAIPAESEAAPPERFRKASKTAAGGTVSLAEDAVTPPEAMTAVDEAPAPVQPPPAPETAAKATETPALPATMPAPKQPAPAKPAAARNPTGKAPRIALDLKKIEAEAIAPRTEAATDHARAKGSRAVESHGAVKWDTSPDPAPSRLPFILLGVAVLAALAAAGWYSFSEPAVKHTPADQRKQLQYEVPAERDAIHELREKLPSAREPERKTTPTPEPAKTTAPEASSGAATKSD